MSKQKIQLIQDFDLHKIADGVATDMNGCVEASQAAGFIKLPDGRVAQVRIVVTTDEDEF